VTIQCATEIAPYASSATLADIFVTAPKTSGVSRAGTSAGRVRLDICLRHIWRLLMIGN
jgi:hypothetical protein